MCVKEWVGICIKGPHAVNIQQAVEVYGLHQIENLRTTMVLSDYAKIRILTLARRSWSYCDYRKTEAAGGHSDYKKECFPFYCKVIQTKIHVHV